MVPGADRDRLGVCGARLIYAGARQRGPWMTFPSGRTAGPLAASRRCWAGLVLHPGRRYARVSFHRVLLMALWTRLMGASWRIVVPVAVLAPIVIHLAFYKLLRIPLPWGRARALRVLT